MKVVILAGGLGTRMREETDFRPKPMVMIGNRPILWHIMRIFSHFNINEFVICTGYRGEVIRNYFSDFETQVSDFTVRLGIKSEIKYHSEIAEEGWKLTIAETGVTTMTGGRLFRASKYITDETFVCTYGDGLANIDIEELISFHKSHGKIATVTAVRPHSRFGVLDLGLDGQVNQFREKPQSDSWINVGFFVFNRAIFEYLNEDSVLENEPLSLLALQGELMAYRHNGFWQPLDTYREYLRFEEMWNSGSAPWKIWN